MSSESESQKLQQRIFSDVELEFTTELWKHLWTVAKITDEDALSWAFYSVGGQLYNRFNHLKPKEVNCLNNIGLVSTLHFKVN